MITAMPARHDPQSLSGRVAIRAHAKINLALAVAPPITDPDPVREHTRGMHPIASWMAPIGLFDEVVVERADTTTHRIAWQDGSPDGTPVQWPTESDLAARAHRAMEQAAGVELPARLTVRKSIPAGGGLGGGSSDAAATLRAINHLFKIGYDSARLRSIASTLGSDIPFFIPEDPHPDTLVMGALVTGLGEAIEPAPVRGCVVLDHEVSNPEAAGHERPDSENQGFPLTLVFPPFGCPTGDVYRVFDESIGAGDPFRGGAVAELARAGIADDDRLFNDLAGPACLVRPELGVIRDAVASRLGRRVHVSGSGSTLFCLGVPVETVRPVLPAGCVAAGSVVLCSFS